MAREDSPPNDATAQTLNYALGNLGGRQKSWMQAANPSAHLTPAELSAEPLPFTMRKRGRPRKHPLPPPPSTETVRPTIEPQAESQPPSNSTSPHLANAVTRPHNANHTASLVTVFPSPTPSEENMESAPVPALQSANGMANLDLLDLSADQAAYAPNTPLETVFMDEARRVGSGLKRPSESARAEAPKRVRQEQPRMQAGTTQGPQITFAQPTYPEYPRRPSVPQGHVDSPQMRQLQSRSPSLGQGHMPSPQRWQGMQMHSTAMTSPQVQAPFGTADALSGGTDPSLCSAPAVSNAHFDPVLFPMTPFVDLQTTWYTRQECLNVLNTFQASCAVSPDHQRDGRRINVLRDATNMQDWQYLVMHQYLRSLQTRSQPICASCLACLRL
jgi:hypothetical protein